MLSLIVVTYLSIFCVTYASDEVKGDKNVVVDCSTLRLGQYICPDPSLNQIDPDTQQYRGCTKGKDIASEGEAEGNVLLIHSF